MDQLKSIAVFVQAADAGSFTAAAKGLAMSPTMVGNHVRALETYLGERLIERTTRRHELTEIGAAYLERCRDVLASVEAAEHVGEALRAVPKGRLRMTAPVSYGAHRLTPVIGAYMAANPGVNVELSLNDRVIDLAEEGFDVGIRSGRVADESLVARPLARSQMYAVANHAYLNRHGTPVHPSDLEDHNCLGFMAWGRNHSWRFTRASETAYVPVQGNMISNNGQALLSAALSGVGVIVQADVLLDPYIASGQLAELLPDWSLPTRAVYVTRRRDLNPSAKVRSFVDFIEAKLGANAEPA